MVLALNKDRPQIRADENIRNTNCSTCNVIAQQKEKS